MRLPWLDFKVPGPQVCHSVAFEAAGSGGGLRKPAGCGGYVDGLTAELPERVGSWHQCCHGQAHFRSGTSIGYSALAYFFNLKKSALKTDGSTLTIPMMSLKGSQQCVPPLSTTLSEKYSRNAQGPPTDVVVPFQTPGRERKCHCSYSVQMCPEMVVLPLLVVS